MDGDKGGQWGSLGRLMREMVYVGRLVREMVYVRTYAFGTCMFKVVW